MDEGYRVHLANPAAIQKYSGLKHSDDASDAAWLAEMLRLDVLPEGYIYPKAERPIRDLLRKRGHLVRLRTSLITSLQGIISRNNGHSLTGTQIKHLKINRVAPLCDAIEDLALCGEVSKDAIDYFGRQIKRIEKQAVERIELRPAYKALLSMPGFCTGKDVGSLTFELFEPFIDQRLMHSMLGAELGNGFLSRKGREGNFRFERRGMIFSAWT